ncbi:hypothetical protein JQ604_39905 [Bradyrhizobium jicamae]|uniref:hypothetical protein n=1 Tax=Bradyrhizobium jicamae TaxID=280332 RepID=UPI001BADE0DD|nr:hypothetical protein [Bradyrhizobium jicamae]MBR0758380.1 hypothetical protein [Bradyrhizobium jicamae]
MTSRTFVPQRSGLLIVALALTLSFSARAFAADAAERPYDPPVGSKWLIESETRSDDQRPDSARASLTRMRAELTIDERTADGFRITYVNRGAEIEGNDKMLPLVRSAISALKDVPIHATTDRAGKPVRVDNLDEAKAALRNAVTSLTAPFRDKPELAAVMTQMMAGLIEVDADKAAASYLEEMPLLARAQMTGMKLHEIRRSTNEAANPLGGSGGLKSNTAFELTELDAATGRRMFTATTSYDVASMKDFMQSVSKKLMAAAGSGVTPGQIDSLVKDMVLSLDERTVFEVEDGITRKVREKSVTAARALGHNMQKTEERTITVTRVP